MKGLFALTLLVLAAAPAVFSQTLEHETTDRTAPVVYFTSDISSQGLMKVYKALGQKLSGKVGIKVSFGGPDEQCLDASLLTDLIAETGGTMIDSNGLSGNRWTSEMNYALARANGFTAVGPVQMLDEDGDMDLPLEGGYYLKFARTGKHFAEYGSFVAVHRFKMHYLEALGCNMKNISLNLSSKSGKDLIHSGGTDDKRYHPTEPEVLAKSFADAATAAVRYNPNWAFIEVLDSFRPTDSCPETANLGDIGIIASLDVVALDQCAVDLYLSHSSASDEAKQRWLTYHQVNVLEYAESEGLGKRQYRLVEVK